MNEAVFPILGALLVFTLALPSSALAAKGMLYALGRIEATKGTQMYDAIRYTILVASSAVPLTWFVSASLHQAETGRSTSVCAAVHGPEALCAEAAFFALAIALLAGSLVLPRLVREEFLLRPSFSNPAERVRTRLMSTPNRAPATRSVLPGQPSAQCCTAYCWRSCSPRGDCASAGLEGDERPPLLRLVVE